jgi:hypothetical protein
MGFIPDPKTTKLYLQISHFTVQQEVVISRPLTQATACNHSVVLTCICCHIDEWTKLGKLQTESLSCTKYVASQLLQYYHITSQPTVTCASPFPSLHSVNRKCHKILSTLSIAMGAFGSLNEQQNKIRMPSEN